MVLTGRLKPALQRLNPDLPMEAIGGAVEEISRDFFLSALSLVEANREIDKLLKGGAKVSFLDKENGGQRTVSFQSKSTGGCNALKNKVFLFKWKTST